ncbi:MAG: tetratricopeptide repeat protein [Cyclobacteriaceae bacterium]|nr:tetratricopeptide repeat protein [Cyclobacteriaceae bacterium]
MSRFWAGLGSLAACFAWLIAASCSSNQNTVTADFFHNTTAHYNGYFYAREKTVEVERLIQKSLDDDPNQILRLYPKLDTVLAKTYAKDTEEIIKMASISIQRHPNSKWVDDNYVLVGLARLYACDWENAIQTFKYVNTKSNDAAVRHKALVHLLRTFTEMGEYDKAEEVGAFLEKQKLERETQKNFYLNKAYYFQVRNNYDYMVRSLTQADSLLSRTDRKGRIYFLIGQIYQQLGFSSLAYNYYRKCLSTNPDYEIDFYARLNMAQVAQLNDSRSVRTVRKQFEKMLTDSKNAEFVDKIYYELGEFERKQGNLPQALDDFELAAHSGTNKRVQGQSFLRMGQIYFDSLQRYTLAKNYYDSAVQALPRDFENLDAIKKRQEILGEFALHTETIIWNDSLLTMAAMDSLSLRHVLDSVVAARQKPVVTSKKKRKRNTGGPAAAGPQSEFFRQLNQDDNTTVADWYFGNPSAVALGQSEFQRIWGNITLEDNWRRSNKAAEQLSGPQVADTEPVAKDSVAEIAKTETTAVDEVGRVFAQLPRTDKQVKEANGKIEEAYFRLGDLYYFQLLEKENAAESYEKLLNRYPQSARVPETLYKLYLIEKEKGSDKAELYAQRLKDQYPNSTFTRILINPDYLKETSVAAEKQKMIYKEAYTYYQENNLRLARARLEEATALGETFFSPQLELLGILLTGKTEDIARYQYELGEFEKKYAETDLGRYAGQLLATSRALTERLEKAKGIKFIESFNEPHYFVVIYKTADRLTNAVATAIDRFNSAQWKEKNLQTSSLVLSDELVLTLVQPLADQQEALAYFDKFRSQIEKQPPFSMYKFNTFVITKDNFQIFYKNKALDEYLTFFDRNYQNQTP